MWYIYVLLCCDNSFYCGITTNLTRRLKQHNGEIKGGAKYTRGRRPCQIIYTKKAMNRSIASKEEFAFKKLSRKQKEKYLVENQLSDASSSVGSTLSSQSSPSSKESCSQAGSVVGIGSSHPSSVSNSGAQSSFCVPPETS
mgnify:CR=1 FL=1